MHVIERSKIQGMLLYGYGRLPFTYYLFLSITDVSKFKNWLGKSRFQGAVSSPNDTCVNIAFSALGFKKLGLEVNEENGFSRAFIEGMDTPHRNRILGDFDANSPRKWEWGNKEDKYLHVALMLFAKDKSSIQDLYNTYKSEFRESGIEELHNKIEASLLPGDKEHFGFADGISQPVIKGLGRKANEGNYFNAGEFILGYPNEYEQYPNSPQLKNDGYKLGKNGSYMVFRQLEQNVPLFWRTVCSYFRKGENTEQKSVELASKIVGRWPNGNPLTREKDEKMTRTEQNDFTFYKEDKLGTKCPFGSHIRRTNPRDSLSKSSKDSAIQMATDSANKHRILRRGRPYGSSIDPKMEIEKIINSNDDGQKRGLNFICFNSDIERQFEFVQHTWINNMKFHNLYNDVDPLVGVQNGGKNEKGDYKMQETQFEVQSKPVRKRYKQIPPFIQVKGGAYFFMPGLDAIEYLSR